MFSYVDDVYMGGAPRNVALALATSSKLYALIGLFLGWGPRKTKLQVPGDNDLAILPIPQDEAGRPLPEVVSGFASCLGVPRHPSNCSRFITKALKPLASRHDSSLDLVADVSEEDPFAALRLL